MSSNFDPYVNNPNMPLEAVFEQIEQNFLALVSSFAGTVVPSGEPGRIFFNSDKFVLSVYANQQWCGLMTGNNKQKIWIYRNDAMPGWQIDDSVVDKVLSIKGGENAYNVDGGTIGGNWAPSHTHGIDFHDHDGASGATVQGVTSGKDFDAVVSIDGITTNDNTGPIDTDQGGTTENWRPAAAVGTLQSLIYPIEISKQEKPHVLVRN